MVSERCIIVVDCIVLTIAVFPESLRKYPIFDNLLRVSRDTYQVPNSKIVLEKGTRVIVPVIGIHRDTDIYPEPMKFDPDRFSKENVAARHPYSFLPFGEGPRNCLGKTKNGH